MTGKLESKDKILWLLVTPLHHLLLLLGDLHCFTYLPSSCRQQQGKKACGSQVHMSPPPFIHIIYLYIYIYWYCFTVRIIHGANQGRRLDKAAMDVDPRVRIVGQTWMSMSEVRERRMFGFLCVKGSKLLIYCIPLLNKVLSYSGQLIILKNWLSPLIYN